MILRNFFWIAALGLLAPWATAQMPQHLNHQGRVSVQGVNFNGTGQFKFALVDAGTPFGTQATAEATLVGDSVGFIGITNFGAGYIEPPLVTITGDGTGATAVATLNLGIVGEIVVTNGGSGYTTAPTVTIAAPPAQTIFSTYWSNDGTSSAGEEPTTSVALPVQNGLYSVQLGGNGMASFDPNIFATPLHLRIWFNDGTHGFQQLTPDQPLAAAPYAMTARLADTVPPGSIGGFQLANGAVSSTKLSPGAAAANLNASGQSGIPSGGVVLSATENPSLVAAGYVKLAPAKLSDNWTAGSAAGAPVPASSPACVWTGTELFVWIGGASGGGLYNPATNSWTSLYGNALNAPPEARDNASAIWTGTEVIVWGGTKSHSSIILGHSDGGRYNPATNTWQPISSTMPNAPAGRTAHTAVWTGSKMIVWGGISVDTLVNTGGIYDPAANGGNGSWIATTLVDAPPARVGHTAVWTGSEMVVWGGTTSSGGVFATGDRFTVSEEVPAGQWENLSDAAFSLPEGRTNHSMIWTGTHMVLWGGTNGLQNFANGYRYEVDRWVPLATAGDPPSPRYGHSALWTGTEMIIWGGYSGVGLASGRRYSFTTSHWDKLTDAPESVGRSGHDAFWTGSQMVVWGGELGNFSQEPWLWTPERQLFLYQRP